MEHITKIRVRYAETDQMRRAYHANYLVWFECARINMLRENDIPYAQLEEEGYYLPVVEAHLNYKAPALFDEEIEILANINKMPRARIEINYRVFNNNGKLLADGYTYHTFMDAMGKPVRPPALFIRVLIEKLQEQSQ